MISVQRLGTLELEREFNKPQRDCNQSLRHVYRERLRPACYPSKSKTASLEFHLRESKAIFIWQRAVVTSSVKS